jgi:N,N'-diacetyllegionaminate synthase
MTGANYFLALPRCYLIAEIGVNHNGDIALAKKMVIAAKEAGADAVKFQTFTAVTLVGPDTPKVSYQERTTAPAKSHYEMIESLELGRPEHEELFAFCAENEIDFLSTPYDVESARFLAVLGVKMFKTASADLVDLPLQAFIAATGKPSLVATGMANLDEIRDTVAVYDRHKNQNLLLLHCVSNYPCSDVSLNLRAMTTMAREFGKPVGYSDHSRGPLAAALSIALGARVVEKHFTLDRKLPGPDHLASSTPDEFHQLVEHIRLAEVMLGSERKEMQPEEAQMASVSRKSLVTARAVKAGAAITAEDLQLMRPGTGIPAKELGKVVGRRARQDLAPLHRVRWSDLSES